MNSSPGRKFALLLSAASTVLVVNGLESNRCNERLTRRVGWQLGLRALPLELAKRSRRLERPSNEDSETASQKGVAYI